jgi:transposase-like protein
MATPAKTGRKTLLNEQRQEAIATMLRAGAYIDDACRAVGIHRTTFYNWLQRGNIQRERLNAGLEIESDEQPFLDFLDTIEEADAEGIIGHVMNIDNAAKNGTWQASAWILERKQPRKWGRYDRTEISGPEGGPIQITVSTEELERKVARILERRELEA